MLAMSWLVSLARSRGFVPQMSSTEREALEAGTVWVDGELFSGRPDFGRMLRESYPRLTSEEQAFLDGPTEEVCRMIDPWEVAEQRQLPESALRFLRENGFFGLVIPREYGGKAFSSLACSAIFGKLASRSVALSTLVLIPNSVGPGELLVAYGTSEQKNHYLRRLASGEEIPCFALTEPEAGSDAAAIRSEGVVFRKDDRLWLRLRFDKRYITLAPIATLIGLAVKVRDPENLLDRGEDVGITCLLVPARAPGVEIGRRHDAMGVPFPNGPLSGRDVVVPVDAIIGGVEWAGRGWQMLMEALSSGRAVSLPAQSVAGAKMIARGVGAYAAVRRQFGLAIGRFEGIEEPLARIAGAAYLMEAARVYTCGAVDGGQKPSVISAVVKYQQTELLRRLVTDGMDVMGGAGLCRGPRNLIARGYVGAPIGITVEGANILTRTLIVYGQGAIRCHPYAQREIRALAEGRGRALVGALLGHAGFFVRNVLRATALSLTRGQMARSPLSGPTGRYVRKLAWASAGFAALSDLALLAFRGRLKQKGKLTGRFADALAWMYFGVAALRRYEAEGRPPEDAALVRWSLEHALHQVQLAFDGILRNFGSGPLGLLLRGPLALWSRLNPISLGPSDRLGAQVARTLLSPGAQRDRLTAGVFWPLDAREQTGRLEMALGMVAQAAPIEERIRQAVRARKLPRSSPEEGGQAALEAGIITAEEQVILRVAAAAREDAIRVDSFPPAPYFRPADAPAEQERAGVIR